MRTTYISRLVIAAIVCWMLAGCGGGGGGSTSSEAVVPSFTEWRVVRPQGFTFEGGTVTIEGRVTSTTVRIRGTVYRPDGQPLSGGSFQVAPQSGGEFSVGCAVPGNGRSDNQAETYSVVVQAYDAGGNSGSMTMYFQVPAPEGPPPNL